MEFLIVPTKIQRDVTPHWVDWNNTLLLLKPSAMKTRRKKRALNKIKYAQLKNCMEFKEIYTFK